MRISDEEIRCKKKMKKEAVSRQKIKDEKKILDS